jgi:ubiquinone/menaquinone biosynthesis C-methylase UbiE/DNA-binding transcriptional ArsR family regulator
MTPTALFGQMTALADPTRSRLLLALERNELTVNELTSILQLPQSTISRHLKMLSAEGWLEARAEGTSRHYRIATDSLDAASRRLWHLVRDEVMHTTAAEHDARRTQAVLAERSTKSQQFFSTSAGQWDRMRLDLFGRRADVALLGLLDESWKVADLGCGTGAVSQALAPFVNQVIAVDESNAMLSAARKRLRGVENVDIRNGRLEAIPIADDEVDVALLFLVLHYATEPAKVIAEAVRVLKPGGRVLVLDMMPHDRQDLRQTMGHLWQGFDSETLTDWMQAAGLEGFRYNPLPPDPEARGPNLFAASGRRVAAATRSSSRKKADAVPLMKTA